jgi:hypothetical protein
MSFFDTHYICLLTQYHVLMIMSFLPMIMRFRHFDNEIKCTANRCTASGGSCMSCECTNLQQITLHQPVVDALNSRTRTQQLAVWQHSTADSTAQYRTCTAYMHNAVSTVQGSTISLTLMTTEHAIDTAQYTRPTRTVMHSTPARTKHNIHSTQQHAH